MHRHPLKLLYLILALAAGAVVGLQTSIAAQAAPALTAQITLSGTSTVRPWKCSAGEATLALQADTGFTNSLFAGVKAVHGLQVTITVGKIDCGNSKMEDHLRKALKAGQFQLITFTLSDYVLTPNSAELRIAATGELTIAGTAKTITLNVSAALQPDGSIVIHGEQGLLMTDFGVTPPKLMFGALKVHDPIVITFSATVR